MGWLRSLVKRPRAWTLVMLGMAVVSLMGAALSVPLAQVSGIVGAVIAGVLATLTSQRLTMTRIGSVRDANARHREVLERVAVSVDDLRGDQRKALQAMGDLSVRVEEQVRCLGEGQDETALAIAGLRNEIASLRKEQLHTGHLAQDWGEQTASGLEEIKGLHEEQGRSGRQLQAEVKAAAKRVGQVHALQKRADQLLKDVHTAQLRPHFRHPGRPRVLFMSSNGAGLGHLTRLMAVAERLDVEREFLTMSTGHGVASYRGHKVSYFPSAAASGLESPVWQRALASFLREFLAERQPDMVVFDGTAVYLGVIHATRISSIPLVWIQRGCWRPERDRHSLQRHAAAEVCDAVVLPGDYGCVESPNLGKRIHSAAVGPITLLDRGQVLPPEEALAELSLEAGPRYVLVQLGAGNINDTTALRETAIESVRGLGPEWVPVVVQSPISVNKEPVEGALTVESYPVARQLAAFEFAVGAAGYNFVQECAGFGVPAVLVPNLNTVTDDQRRRAKGIVDLGGAESAETPEELRVAIRSVSEKTESMRAALSKLSAPSGGAEAAEVIEDLLETHRGTWLPEPGACVSGQDGFSGTVSG